MSNAPHTTSATRDLPGTARTGVLRIAHETAEAARARAWVGEWITAAPWPVAPDVADDIVLCAGETITNAVVHSRPRLRGDLITIVVTGDPAAIRVEVTDTGNAEGHVPIIRDDAPELMPSGRGLRIVQELSNSWGHNGNGDRNNTWFELRLS